MSTTAYSLERGTPHPLGATPDDQGVNFSVFSLNATRVTLLLFEKDDSPRHSFAFELDSDRNKTFHFWHCYVRGLSACAYYAFRVYGPFAPSQGLRFDSQKVLVDPYAKGITDAVWDRGKACAAGDNEATSVRCVAVDPRGYDWEGDRPLGRPMNQSIIYETHVRGFTMSPTSGVADKGTFKGLIAKIPYLAELGITAVELLPVMDFDETEILQTDPDGKPLRNYWGYSTVNFFAPHSAYTVDPKTGCHVDNFRDMVKAFHKAGIEVILDVVFNHTSEGNEHGPTINFRGFDNEIFYHLVSGDRQYYMDYSGCGNTVNCNHPMVAKWITDCLRFWVEVMHVDGFRFDEGAILCRGMDGEPMDFPPVVWNIELDDAFVETKIIAEAWDAHGLYQVGTFPGFRWAEWNGKFRDCIRRFVKGDAGQVGDAACRIAGSSDLFQTSGHEPLNSINFVTCHDGFTLNDLVSYNQKHNFANGENNNDGANENQSWNCGMEGPSSDPEIEALRSRQVKNFLAILLLSQGVPMILGGDEFRRTQSGNNNAYCQDNEVSWFDWTLLKTNAGVFRFFKEMIALRKSMPTLQRQGYFTGASDARGIPDIVWHGADLNGPGWNNPECRVLAFTLGGDGSVPDLHVMLNMHWEAVSFAAPAIPGFEWRIKVNTGMASPQDIFEKGQEPGWHDDRFLVGARSVAVLLSHNLHAQS